MRRRAGTHKRAAWSLDPGLAAHHAAGAARCAASEERKHASAPLAAPCARVMSKFFAPKRAWGMPGARCTRSRACRVDSTRVSHHGRTGTPGIPARDGFNGVLRALPGDRALLSPSSPRSLLLKNLTPTIEASGPHDFTVRKPALSSAAQPASIASRAYVRDDRETPLCVGRDGPRWRSDLGQKKTRIFLRGGTGQVETD
jgi:hypothetical protein